MTDTSLDIQVQALRKIMGADAEAMLAKGKALYELRVAIGPNAFGQFVATSGLARDFAYRSVTVWKELTPRVLSGELDLHLIPPNLEVCARLLRLYGAAQRVALLNSGEVARSMTTRAARGLSGVVPSGKPAAGDRRRKAHHHAASLEAIDPSELSPAMRERLQAWIRG